MTTTPVRQEYEVQLQPLPGVPLERELPVVQRLWQQGWLRKALILVLLAGIWEAVARYTGNDLLLPSFLQTATALGVAWPVASCRPRSVFRWWYCSRAMCWVSSWPSA